MKILHIADLHLDSAFSGFSKEGSDERRRDLRDCFTRAMREGKERGVSLVLIAGDLFDTPFCCAETRKVVFDAIREIGCPVVISPGNHDYYNKNGTYADKNLPENAYVFTSETPTVFNFENLGISVAGYAFTSDRYESDPLASPISMPRENICLLCAHADLGARMSKYAPISPNAIARGGFAYAALGHVHNAPEPVVAGATTIAYSGFMQGRSFDELSSGGAYIADIDPQTHAVALERTVTSRLAYEIEKSDITSLDCDADVAARARGLISDRGYGSDTALRIVLLGAVPSHYSPRAERIEELLADTGLALIQIKDGTSANFDLGELENDRSVRGEVYRLLTPSLDSEDSEERARASLALKFALAALDKREFGVE